MDRLANLFFVCILAGFALIHMPEISFLAGMTSFFHVVGALAILVFSFVLLYLGIKALFTKL
ncbi:hypothetical protein [Neobacillus vireti]|uniref:Uncharacterized protein n=1 Tax=Neobacillus vireti LMG 21834 TaxID=1131730 RepID=A0AB94IH11_9BACI|nr:hypothetical protein [Neobacillus vireti]ETI66404.1 hypothetical protein BAVI_22763 [Neobacillus vireti LMG 21834]KLT19136.1 hypothetical protein AA980_00565 [Neobacillus vireti]